MNLKKHWKLILPAIIGIGVILAALIVAMEIGLERVSDEVRSRVVWLRPESSVRWDTASPESVGLDKASLDAFKDDLSNRKTDSLIVVKDNKIVYEWYAPGELPNKRTSIASMAKSVVGATILSLSIDQGYINPDDPAWKYIPEWADDPEKSSITVRHLMTHSAGIENVEFKEGLTGWHKAYFEEDDQRFAMSIQDAPLIFSPGDQYDYSGTGYYALAYILAASFQNGAESDIMSIYENQVMEPLGIPRSEWRANYGDPYHTTDDLKLYAVGSGASFSPRAIARIGQLMLQKGVWDGNQIISANSVEQISSYDGITPPVNEVASIPPPSLGWWTNSSGIWPAVPRDAFVGLGRGHQVLLVIPSLDMVVVRTGKSLGETSPYALKGNTWPDLEKYFLIPLMKAIGESDSE